MPGAAKTNFLSCADACSIVVPASTHSPPSNTLAMVRIMVLSSDLTRAIRLLFFQLKFRFPSFAHQRLPDMLAQRGEARLAQCLARARMRQIDLDRFADAARPSLQHENTVAHQHGFFDRMRDEHHRGRATLPDAQQLEL